MRPNENIPEESPVSWSRVVGANVRRWRKVRGMTQEDFAEALSRFGIHHSQSTIAQLESGGRKDRPRDATVEELGCAALVLGVAPHLLLYPEPGVDVGVEYDEDGPIAAAVSGPDLADWLWDPDPHHLTQAEESAEEAVWLRSAELGRQLQATRRDIEARIQEAKRRQVERIRGRAKGGKGKKR